MSQLFWNFVIFLQINTETGKHNLRIFLAFDEGISKVIFKATKHFPAFKDVSRVKTFTFISRYPLLHAYLHFKGNVMLTRFHIKLVHDFVQLGLKNMYC